MTEIKRTIKETYDAAPDAGDDLSKESLFAGDDGANTPVAYTRTQVSNTIATVGTVREIDERVAALETGTTPPDPDPDPTPTPTFTATIPDDRLYYDISIGNYTTKAGAGWAVTYNDTAEPSTFTSGNWVSTQPVPDVDDPGTAYASSYTVRFWQTDDVDGPTEVLNYETNPAGDSGIEITPRYVTDPITPTIETPVVGAAGSGEVDITFTPDPNYPPGIASSTIKVFNEGEDPLNDGILTFVNQTSPATLTNVPQGVSLFVTVTTIGNNGLESIGVSSLFTAPVDTTPTYNGRVSILAASPRYEELESTATVDITVQVTGSQTDNNVEVDLRTIGSLENPLHTATGGVNYTADTGSTVPITVTGGTGSATYSVSLLNAVETTNLEFQVEIIPDSAVLASDGVTPVDIDDFPNDATLVFIGGTGSTTGTRYAISNINDGSETADAIVIEANHFSLNEDNGAAVGWTEITSSVPSGGAMKVDGGPDYTVSPDYLTTAPKLTFNCDFGSVTGIFFLDIKSYASTGGSNQIWPMMDGAPSWSNPGVPCRMAGSTSSWDWVQVNDTNGNRISINITEGGAHTFGFHVAQAYAFPARFCLYNNSAFDPSAPIFGGPDPLGDDNVGPPESSLASNDVIDNAANATFVTRPVPTTAVFAVDSTIPDDNATLIGLTQLIQFFWPVGTTDINVITFSETNIQGGGSINVSGFTSTGTANDLLPHQLTWQPLQTRLGGDEHQILGTGTCVFEGATRRWEIAAGEMTFTTRDTGGYTLESDMTGYTPPSGGIIVTPTILEDIFGYGGGDGTARQLARGNVYLVQDPLGGSETVMRFTFRGGEQGNVFTLLLRPLGLTNVGHCMLELCVSPNWLTPASIHGPQWRAVNFAGDVQPDWYFWAQQWHGNSPEVDALWGGSGPWQGCAEAGWDGYLYDQTRKQFHVYSNPGDPTDYTSSAWPIQGQPTLESTSWHQYEHRIVINTDGSANGSMQGYFDGNLAINRTGIKLLADGFSEDISLFGLNFFVGGSNDPKWSIPLPAGEECYLYLRKFILNGSSITF